MTASLPTTLADRINPIALKELRQAVNSRSANGLLLFTLALLSATLGLYAFRFSADAGPTEALGLPLFGLLQGVLFLAIGLGVPTLAGCRLGLERASGEGDLLLATPLSPMRILRGKVLSAAAVALLLLAACTPFLTICVLLRGVGLTQLAGGVVLQAFTFGVGICVALFLGAIPLPPAAKTLLAGGAGLVAAAVLAVGFALGLGVLFAGGFLWFLVGPVAFVVVIVGIGAGLLLLGAATMISPRGLRAWEADEPDGAYRRRVAARNNP